MATKKTLKCTKCGIEYQFIDFYISRSRIFEARGRLPVCKDCIDELYNEEFLKTKSHKVALYRICRLFDIPFKNEMFNSIYVSAQKRKTKPYKIYFQTLNSVGSRSVKEHSFAEGDSIELNDAIVNEKYEDLQKTYLTGFEVTSDMVLFWGGNLDREDYWFLSEQYSEWENTYEIDSKTLQELVKQICFTQLIIDKKRSRGENVDSDLNTYQKLLTSCNFKPNQENMMNAAEQATFGTLIKKWENEQPIPEPDPKWKDVDGIMKYVKVWFTGHLAKMMGVETDYSKMYEEEISKYTVEEGN